MLHELPLFPVRPARLAGESLAGYFSRHFGNNGHWVPKALHDAVATVYRSEDPLRRLEAWALISKVMGEPADDYRRFWIEERFTLTPAQAISLKRHWQRPFSRRVRLCPECVHATGAHLALWDLPLVFACPVHKCLLVSHCQCGKPLAWANIEPNWTCSCGLPLSSLSARTAPRSLVRLAMSVAATAGLHVPDLDREEAHHHRLADTLRSTYDVLAWLRALVRELRGPSSLKLPANASEHWRFGPLLDDWPNGLVRSIRHVLKRWHQYDRTSHLVHLEEHGRTQRVLHLLDEAMANDALPPALRSALAEIPKGLRPSASAPRQWIINPALSARQRERRHTLLPTWWRGLSCWIDSSTDLAHEGALRLHEPGEVEGRVCVKLLNRLVAAAEQSAEPTKFHRFARAWPPMPADADRLTTDEFLDLIGRKLLAVSTLHRGYLFETALEAAGVTSVVA